MSASVLFDASGVVKFGSGHEHSTMTEYINRRMNEKSFFIKTGELLRIANCIQVVVPKVMR